MIIFFSITPVKHNDQYNIIYSGNAAKYQGIDIYLNTIKNIKNNLFKKFNFFIQTNDLYKLSNNFIFQELINSNKITCLKYVPHNQFPDFFRNFHISIIPRPNNSATYFSFPQKLVEHLSLGRLVIASNIAPHRIAIKNNINGFLFNRLDNILYRIYNNNFDPNIPKIAQEVAYKYHYKLQTLKMYQKIIKILG